MTDRVVVNASPLSGLLAIGREGRGLIHSVRDECQLLKSKGFRLSDRLIARLLAEAGEV